MFRRNFPLIVLLLIFVGLLDLLWQIPVYKPPVKEEPESVPDEPGKPFTGRMTMPSLEEIYVLENTAGRDIAQLEKYIQGRAAGLHWLSQEHFKNKKNGDISLGLHLTVDSLGVFHCLEIMFSDADDAAFEGRLVEHIQYFWRYRRSEHGKTEFWIPLRWKAKP
jgi:hypothetical protein